MKVITAIYLNCRPDLRDEWLTTVDVENDLDESLVSMKLEFSIPLFKVLTVRHAATRADLTHTGQVLQYKALWCFRSTPSSALVGTYGSERVSYRRKRNKPTSCESSQFWDGRHSHFTWSCAPKSATPIITFYRFPSPLIISIIFR